MEENTRNGNVPEEINESNAARRMRLRHEDMGEDVRTDDIKVNKIGNFLYHNKIKIIIIAFFAVVLTIAVTQFIAKDNPDLYIIYGGNERISANDAKEFTALAASLMDDYNGDGKKKVQINDFVFMTPEQVERITSETDSEGNYVTVNLLENKTVYDRFSDEIFGPDAGLCILCESQFRTVEESGGFVPLAEIFGEVPEGAVDGFGIRLSETKLYKFYSAARVFPADAVLALRRVSSMGALPGMGGKAETAHSRGEDLFRKIMAFEYPEGFVPEG